MSETITRRAAIAGACACSALALAACSSSEPVGSNPSAPASSGGSGGGGGNAAAGIPTADVPVGGGIVDESTGEPIVITQPVEGEFHVFSGVCTHQGCTVAVDGDTITCACHGSAFDLATGDATNPPATEALPAVDFSVDGDTIVLA